jgi:hypothetical protein
MAKSALMKKVRSPRRRQIAIRHGARRALGAGPGDKLRRKQHVSEFRGKLPRAGSPFEKYSRIGNPAIPAGRRAVNRIIRQLRGR